MEPNRNYITLKKGITSIVIAISAGSLTAAQASSAVQASDKDAVFAKIIQHEDERNADQELVALLNSTDPEIEQRAIVALGRIGDRIAIAPLSNILSNRSLDTKLRILSAFALGEIESDLATSALVERLDDFAEPDELRSRAAEALGKIAANKESGSKLGNDGRKKLAASIGKFLRSKISTSQFNQAQDDVKMVSPGLGKTTRLLIIGNEQPPKTNSAEERRAIGLALIALLRISEIDSVQVVTEQLSSPYEDVRATAANVLSRMKLDINSATPLLIKCLKDPYSVVRANAARALAVAKDRTAVEPLIQLLSDSDVRAVASSVNALGAIGDSHAVRPLVELVMEPHVSPPIPSQGIADKQNLVLLIASALGAIKDKDGLPLLKTLRFKPFGPQPEIETALANFGESVFFAGGNLERSHKKNWQSVAAYAQGLGQLKSMRAESELLVLQKEKTDARAVPDILKALAACKSEQLEKILLAQLLATDFVVRATAATLLGELAHDSSEVIAGLRQALFKARSDKMNDARLAIIETADKLKHPFNQEVLSGKLRDQDYIVRRRAFDLEQQSGRSIAVPLGKVATGHNEIYWSKMVHFSRSTNNPLAVVRTKKGEFTIELFSRDAPMTVNNFIELSRKGFYNGLTFMRVVPNFVIQGGDPRNDMNGGPGYQIRCEINLHPYVTGTVGMALSGKDTGGSQFFITHSPQPHLDGGYTAFGQVIQGMEVVNRIARGDKIESIEIIGLQ